MNTNETFHEATSIATALLTGVLLTLSACEVEDEDAMLDEAEAVDDEVDEDDAEFRAWTGYTSDGRPPVTCRDGYYMRGVQCRGQYCGEMRMDCYDAGYRHAYSYWTSYFSDEGSGGNDERHCGGGEYVTGLSCRGESCDRLALRCSKAWNRWHSNCRWSGWHSDEDPPYYTPDDYYVKGMECDGRYCDWKRYYYCRMVPE